MIETLSKLTEELACEVVAKAGPKLIEYIRNHKPADDPDPLLTTKEAAAALRIGETTLRQLVTAGFLKKAPGFRDIRIRKSILDSYGKDQKKK